MRSSPPAGIASRALIARLMTASSSWVASASTGHRSGAKIGVDRDAAADGPGEQFGHPAQLGIQVDRRPRQRLSSRKGEKLPGQPLAALDRSQRHIDPGLQLITLLPAAQHLERTLQHGQQIVEVVGDAARQLTERLHLLRLAEFGLGLGSPVHLAPAGAAPWFASASWRSVCRWICRTASSVMPNSASEAGTANSE